jgi:serine/threonine protein kinase
VKDSTRHELPRPMLGRYRLICELGSGGMARVYLALTTGLAGFTKLAVLKVMRAELAQDPEAVRLFLGEARLAARFNHPNVVQTTELGEDAGSYFISMEYLEGLPLGTLLGKTQSQPLPLAARLEIACQLLDGLGYLHELSDLGGTPLHLVHRDISPSNVFVTFEGTVKLLDFGVAKAEGVTEVSTGGGFKGKLGYAAPEQLKGQSDARSDIFTAGLLLWEMLSYRRLRRERAYADIVRRRATGTDAFSMRSENHGIPAPLIEICAKAAALDPEERYQSASALRDALRSYMVEHSLRFSAEQLRVLLTERFDVSRQAIRKQIDQRMKAVQLEGAALAPSLRRRSHSQTPHPFVTSSQHRALAKPQLASKARRFLVPAGGVALALAAAFAGASVASSDGSSPLAAVNQRSEVAAARSGAPVVDAGPSNEQPAAGAFVAPPRAPEPVREAAELETARMQREERPSSLGPAASKSSHRADSRAVNRPHPTSRGPKVAVAPGGAPPADRGSPEKARPSTSGPGVPSDFAHGRGTAQVARPIDSSSPYSN